MESVRYLYHYTSVENLALILKNRTIRLNPLDKMDDLQEQRTADVENLGKFVFVSSWTDDPTESIPMWKMYTNPAAGVRIKLRENPFVWHGTTGGDIGRVLGIPALDEASRTNYVRTFLDISKLLDEGYFSPQAWGGNILVPVTYTNDISKLEPKVANLTDGTLSLAVGALGRHKNPYWGFQKEWRYIMQFVSINFKSSMEACMQAFSESGVRMLQGKEAPPFRYFDLDIDPVFLAEMEIVCSPQMTAGNKILLETLVEKYNPSATIRESELLNLI